MSWVTPRTWVAAEIVTAALFNTHIRDNLAEIRAGGIAIASQAAGDVIRGSSATQWARVAATVGCHPRYNGAAWEFTNQVGARIWAVGSIFESVISTSPSTQLGFGTWVALGAGRVTVAIDAGQVEFDTVEETGGAKTVTLATAELPVHTHVQDSHFHTISGAGTSRQVNDSPDDVSVIDNAGTSTTSSVTATNQNTGGGGAHNNVQPSIVLYRWKRTA